MFGKWLSRIAFRSGGIALLVFTACALQPVRPFNGATKDLFLKGAKIIDPKKQTIQAQNLLIHDGKIVAVTDEPPKDFSGEVVDLSGKFVIPGLSDLHVHSTGRILPNMKVEMNGVENSKRVFLYSGVTAFLDLLAPEDEIFLARDRQRAGKATLGSEIYAAGPALTCTGGHGTEYGFPDRTMDTPEQARAVVAALAEKKPDVVKIIYDHAGPRPTLTRETMEAAIHAAKAAGFKTVIHIGTWQDAEEAVLAGADVITHVYETVIPDRLVSLMKSRKVISMPTLSVHIEMADIADNPKILDAPLLIQSYPTSFLNVYRDGNFPDKVSKKIEAQKKKRSSVLESVKKMHDKGIYFLTGTDVQNLGTFLGYSEHRELQLMVDAGLSNWEALKAATTNAGEFLGQHFGVEPGDIANLVVLNSSPIDNIANTQDISSVVFHGAIVDRADLLK